MKRSLLILLIASFIGSLPVTSATTGPAYFQRQVLEVTYIANEGVLLSSGDKQVLIDGLHRQYGIHYSFLPDEPRNRIETAKEPFNKIDLILVSHLHLDHFHPEAVGLHLKHNPGATLVSSQQVIAEIQKTLPDYSSISSRVKEVTPPVKKRVKMRVSGVDLEVLGLEHGSERFRWIQNLGHVIHLGGKKILHIGDADTSVKLFDSFDLDKEEIDIALLPFWFLLDEYGQIIVRDHIKAKSIIALHISPINGSKAVEQIRQAFPDAVPLTKMLEKRQYK